MDTKTLIADAKARFAYKSAQHYLKEKYEAKLKLASQNGLWHADATTITLLSSFTSKKLVLIDTFGNPVEVDRKKLLDELKELYASVMKEYYQEYKSLEGKR